MEAQLKGAVLIALVVVPQWRCPILKPLSAKLPPKSETAPHPGWQDGTSLGLGTRAARLKRVAWEQERGFREGGGTVVILSLLLANCAE